MKKMKSGIVSQKAITILTITAVCMVSVIMVAAWRIKLDLSVDADGYLRPKQGSAVRSHITGFIQEVYVHDNSIIESGQPICSIINYRESGYLGEAITSLKAARGSIESLVNNPITNIESKLASVALRNIDEAILSALRIAKTAERIHSYKSQDAYPTDSDTILSPADGTVVLHNFVKPGRFVSKGEVLGHIEHIAEVEAVLSVDATKIGRIKTGQKVIITTPDGKRHRGRVVQMLGITPATNNRTRPMCILKAGGFENAIKISENNDLSNQPDISVRAKIVVTEGKRIITLLTEAAFRKTMRGHSGQ